jgi:hypothetical protein
MYGQGKLIFLDQFKGKAVFKGAFKANQFHGIGKLLWSNGDSYEGFFENSNYHGEGLFKWGGLPN